MNLIIRFRTECPNCHGIFYVTGTVWDEEILHHKVYCPLCRKPVYLPKKPNS